MQHRPSTVANHRGTGEYTRFIHCAAAQQIYGGGHTPAASKNTTINTSAKNTGLDRLDLKNFRTVSKLSFFQRSLRRWYTVEWLHISKYQTLCPGYSLPIAHFLSPSVRRCGIHQRSVLCPLLFTIYTAELEDVVKRHGCNLNTYSDDNRHSPAVKLEGCVIEVGSGIANNRLKPTPSKHELM